MRFTQDSASSINVIRAYGGGELRINDDTYQGAVIVTPSVVIPEPDVKTLEDLRHVDVARLVALKPELVLLGTGARQSFPPAAFGAQFLKAGIGFEVMDTGAACRTFNVLVMESRQVAALLLPS
jgi:uncharacterized protein